MNKIIRNASKALVVGSVVAGISFAPLGFASPEVESHNQRSDAKAYWKGFKHDANETWKDGKEAFRDGWLESKLETALILSEHLNPFDIDIEVKGDRAILEGTVNSETLKSHAEAVTLNVEGIDKVTNKLKVDKDYKQKANNDAGKRSLSRIVKDTAITADIKTELLANKEVTGLDVDVDTFNGEVTLSGVVDSQAERLLAEYIARSNDGISKVINNIKVES